MFFESDEELDLEDFEDPAHLNYHGEYEDHISRPFPSSDLHTSSFYPPQNMRPLYAEDYEDSARRMEEQYRLASSEYDPSRPKERQDLCSQRGDLPDILEKIGSITLKTIEHAGIIAATLLQKKIIDQSDKSSRGGNSSSASVISSDASNPGFALESSTSGLRSSVPVGLAASVSSSSSNDERKAAETGLAHEINKFINSDHRNYDAY